jgi:Flp pilus assembly protein TadG
MLRRGGRLCRRARALLRPERGQALVEFAVIVPVLLLILLGIIDFGRAVNNWNDLTHVANLAARYAAVGTLPTSGKCPNEPNVTSFVSCELGIDSPALQNAGSSVNGPSNLKICVSIPSSPTPYQSTVQVKIQTTYNWLAGLKLPFSSSNIHGDATQELDVAPPAGWATTTSPCPATLS